MSQSDITTENTATDFDVESLEVLELSDSTALPEMGASRGSSYCCSSSTCSACCC